MKFRRLTAVILAAALLISCATPVFAAEKASYTADCPYIFVHGFMGSDIYVDPDDPDSELAWPPATDDIMDAVKQSLPLLLKYLFLRNGKELGEKLIPIVDELFAPIELAPDGTVKDKSGVRWSYPAKESIKKDSQLDYVYDWRLNPIHTAEGLNDFIDYVLECSGCDQVVVECHSYGGVICNTYAKLFGTEKVRSWVFNSTAVYGETYNGELMTGQIIIDDEALTEYLKGAFDYNDNEKFLNGLFAFLKFTGITKGLCKLVAKLALDIGDKAIGQSLGALFGGWLSVWAMIPDDKIDDAYSYIFDYIYKDDGVDRSGLQKQIQEYNEKIRHYKAETMQYLNENSKLYILARYGYCSLFLTPSWRNASDSTIDVKYASYGATAADYGETLSDDYLSKADKKYISPDKTIDASTCMFPEQTWFIRHYKHAGMCSSMREMSKVFLYYNGQATINTFKEYPAFLYYDEDTEIISADTLSDQQQKSPLKLFG
ncbi:MAG: alpha/beta fold hydrolase [Clostridia bacterium]|nr:alpha/beta fold hydrolase [Clostridia bacterium]